MSNRNLLLYIRDIDDSLKKIIQYTKGLSFNEFVKDNKTVDAVIRNLEIIGEAANNLPQDIKKKYHFIPWRQIVGMRHKVIHEYFGVDVDILWKTIESDIPFLKKNIKQILRDLS